MSKNELNFFITEGLYSNHGTGCESLLKGFETKEEAKKYLDGIYDDFKEFASDLSNTWKDYIKSLGYNWESNMYGSVLDYTLSKSILSDDNEEEEVYDVIGGLRLTYCMFSNIQDKVSESQFESENNEEDQ